MTASAHIAPPSPAMAIALAEIGRAFSIKGTFTKQVASAICLGTEHPVVKERYRARANMLRGYSLTTAVVVVNHWFKQERRAFQIASALGSGHRHSLLILAELRLILRFMRAQRMHGQFAEIVADVLDFQTAA